MRTQSILILFTLLSLSSFAQKPRNIQRDWIKVSVENLSNQEIGVDTLYTRYSFTNSGLNISFYPGWNDHTQTWSAIGKDLKLLFDTYQIEQLDDTALTISLDGFRRIRFLSEEYLSSKAEHLDSIGQHNERPLFRANDYITPRYKGKGSFSNYVQKDVDGYIRKAAYFMATFVVTEDGKVENVIVRNGITSGFDAALIKQLLKSSKQWYPARFNGKAIQTEMMYEIKYLDSLQPGDF